MAKHHGKEDTLISQENDGEKVIEDIILGDYKKHCFFKSERKYPVTQSGIYRIITPCLIVALGLTILLLMPGDDLEGSTWWSTYKIDKLIHIVAFAILGISTSISL